LRNHTAWENNMVVACGRAARAQANSLSSEHLIFQLKRYLLLETIVVLHQ